MSAKSSVDDPQHYEVYALKYAERDARRPDHFIGGDPHDTPMPMDYFVWAIVGDDGEVWVVDTGFEQSDADQRKRRLVRSVGEALATIDIVAADVEQVILTHLHYDHAGGLAQFPNARFHLQDTEMSFATGRDMTHAAIAHSFTAGHIADLVHAVFDGRVAFHDGDIELAPGLTIHHIGGHTKGLQVVRVSTAAGWLVLASDASHYYENMTSGRPFPIVYHLGDMLDGHRRCFELASTSNLVIPGHDPLVLERHSPARPGLDGIAARLA